MKFIVVAGSRNYNNYNRAKEVIDSCIKNHFSCKKITIVSGGCRGADMIGEQYAHERGYEVLCIKADWEKFGRAAGPKRNERMADIADFVICFWDGVSRGTYNMINCAKKKSKQIYIEKI